MHHLLILKETNIHNTTFDSFQANALGLLNGQYALAVFCQTQSAYYGYFATNTNNLATLNTFSRPVFKNYMQAPANLTRKCYFGNGERAQGNLTKLKAYPLSVYQSVLHTHLRSSMYLNQVWLPPELNALIKPNCSRDTHDCILATISSC